jgi:hypothetical protein
VSAIPHRAPNTTANALVLTVHAVLSPAAARGHKSPASPSHPPGARRRHIARYFGPLPPSLGVQRGPSTSVALQSTQFGGFTLSRSPSRS